MQAMTGQHGSLARSSKAWAEACTACDKHARIYKQHKTSFICGKGCCPALVPAIAYSKERLGSPGLEAVHVIRAVSVQ